MRPVARRAIRTTLYDLVRILHTHIGVENDQVITALLSYLLQTKQITSHREWSAKHGRIKRYNNDRFDALSSSLQSQLDPELASFMVGSEPPRVASGFTEDVCDVHPRDAKNTRETFEACDSARFGAGCNAAMLLSATPIYFSQTPEQTWTWPSLHQWLLKMTGFFQLLCC